MNRKCKQSVTTDERRTFSKVLGADKEKVHRDQILGNTGGNNNKDVMFDWRSGCQSEDKCNFRIHMTFIMITTCFCTDREHYRLLFSHFFSLVLSLLCVYYIRLYSHVVHKSGRYMAIKVDHRKRSR